MEEKLRRAFQLAYFILAEEEAALRVTREAVAALDVALAAQDKRIYYHSGSRTKVSLSELQLLQRLVYITAEPEERRQEAQGATAATLLVHYLKHLVRCALKRNSFFVTLGVSRLLHNYSTPETMQIHELVAQDPTRVRDDSYYRRGKAQLFRELLARFGALLTVQRGARGEERFQTQPNGHDYADLTQACLGQFTPWQTACSVPAAFDPHKDELPLLRFRGRDPDGEHEVEVRRMHAVLHPDCFTRLLAALGLEAPTARLELPQFQLTNGSPPANPPDGPPGGPRAPAHLSEEAMQNLKEYLAQQRERRRKFSPIWLRVIVDGAESTRWPLAQSAQISVTIAPHAELIEVYGGAEGGELRLAAHLLSYDENDQVRPTTAALTLEGGQQLSFAVQPQNSAGATVEVSYRETALLRAISWWWRRQGLSGWTMAGLWKPAFALALLTMLGVQLARWLVMRPVPVPMVAVQTSPTLLVLFGGDPTTSPSVAPTALPSVAPTVLPTASPSAPRPTVRPLRPGDDVLAVNIPASRNDADLTRSERESAAGLLEAKKVFLQLDAADEGQRSIGEQVRERLAASGRFRFTADRDEADIALKLTLAPVRNAPDRLSLTARIVDAEGKVIWPLTPHTGGRRYKGSAAKVIEKFSSDLARDLRRLERK